jgi:hypothetical protein
MAFAFLTTPTLEDPFKGETWPAGEAIASVGAAVRKSSDNKLYKSDGAASATEDVYGYAVNVAAGAGVNVSVARPGSVLVTSGLTPGAVYYLGFGADAGKSSAAIADVTTGKRIVITGVALSATRLLIQNIKTGVVV